MPAKSCQLAFMPTNKLKQVLDQSIQAITYVTNLSVETTGLGVSEDE